MKLSKSSLAVAGAYGDAAHCARQVALGFSVRSRSGAKELIIDNFAGGGGASLGIEQAFGRPVDIAINHNGEALAMHTANHPLTAHYQEDVFDIHPGFITGQRPIGLAWFSPDCKHHSKAKGGKPREKKIRGLAWVTLKWGAFQMPRAIGLENVEEFADWGPLDAEGKPIKAEKGRTFKAFIDALSTGLSPDHPDVPEIYEALGADFPMERLYKGLGYAVEYRILRACDFGTPTIRKRLYVFARRDGLPIRWPAPTHGNPKLAGFAESGLLPWRTAAECIQWDKSAPSIFDRKKPLADATNRRIAKGILRYVVNAAQPFIVSVTHQGGDRIEDISKPLNTVTGAHRGEKALVVPTLVQTGYGEREGQSPRALDIQKPLGTIVGGQKHAMVVAFLNEHANASNQRVMSADEPMRTQMAEVKGGHFSLVTASLVKHYSGVVGSDMKDPMGTVTSVDHHSLLTATLVTDTSQHPGASADEPVRTDRPAGDQAVMTAHLTKFRSGSVGSPMDEPVHTVTAGGTPARASTGNVMGMVTANLVHMGHGEECSTGAKRWSDGTRDVEQPLNTVTASGVPAALVTSNIIKLRGTNVGSATDEPLHTISSQGTHHAEVRAFLVKYGGLSDDTDDIGTVVINGTRYLIVDIGLRMLEPRELARAQGFPDSTILDPVVSCKRKGSKSGKTRQAPLSKTAQVRMIGNSVCPPVAKALIEANFAHELEFAKTA